jgi:DNA-binding transcriptional LysR family regulator
MKFIVDIEIMRDLNLASVDLNLLPALEALLRRRHVTRAAEDVGLSQPAMSHILARLREVLGDELLVRGSSGLALTSRAEEIAPRVAAVLNATRAIYQPPPFEVSKIRRALHVAGCDLHSILFVPDLMDRIRKEAPGIQLSIQNYTRDVFKRLEDGSIDLVFADAETPLPPGAVSTVIGDDRYALVMREQHPAAKKKWTVAEYASWESVVVSIFGDGASDVDARLAKAGVARRIGLSTPHFMASLAAVSATDMIATTSHLFATRHAKAYRLIVREPPFPEIRFTSTVIGSALRMNDPVIRWFCALVKEVSESVRHEIMQSQGGADAPASQS